MLCFDGKINFIPVTHHGSVSNKHNAYIFRCLVFLLQCYLIIEMMDCAWNWTFISSGQMKLSVLVFCTQHSVSTWVALSHLLISPRHRYMRRNNAAEVQYLYASTKNPWKEITLVRYVAQMVLGDRICIFSHHFHICDIINKSLWYN